MVNATPRLLHPREIDPVLIVWKAGWNPGPVWTGEENLAPLRFDEWTVQLVASRYTDSAILAHNSVGNIQQLSLALKKIKKNSLRYKNRRDISGYQEVSVRVKPSGI